MKVGIVTPVLTRLPRTHAKWEREAGIAEVARVVVEAERLGYVHVTCSEHVAVPIDVAEVRGSTYWDPLPVFGYLAAQTSRIELVTSVLVLGYHHPLAIAKRYGTLDRVCGGRLILGVGVGSLQPEFDLLGVPFRDRGPRADDAMQFIRTVWGQPRPTYSGPFYQADGWVLDPVAPRTDLTMWVGGRTRRSLRRAASLGDGWMPFGLGPDELRSILKSVPIDSLRPEARPAFDVVLHPEPPLDPVADPAGARAKVEEYKEIGATMCNLRFRNRSLAHYLEQLEALTSVVPEGFPA